MVVQERITVAGSSGINHTFDVVDGKVQQPSASNYGQYQAYQEYIRGEAKVVAVHTPVPEKFAKIQREQQRDERINQYQQSIQSSSESSQIQLQQKPTVQQRLTGISSAVAKIPENVKNFNVALPEKTYASMQDTKVSQDFNSLVSSVNNNKNSHAPSGQVSNTPSVVYSNEDIYSAGQKGFSPLLNYSPVEVLTPERAFRISNVGITPSVTDKKIIYSSTTNPKFAFSVEKPDENKFVGQVIEGSYNQYSQEYDKNYAEARAGLVPYAYEGQDVWLNKETGEMFKITDETKLSKKEFEEKYTPEAKNIYKQEIDRMTRNPVVTIGGEDYASGVSFERTIKGQEALDYITSDLRNMVNIDIAKTEIAKNPFFQASSMGVLGVLTSGREALGVGITKGFNSKEFYEARLGEQAYDVTFKPAMTTIATSHDISSLVVQPFAEIEGSARSIVGLNEKDAFFKTDYSQSSALGRLMTDKPMFKTTVSGLEWYGIGSVVGGTASAVKGTNLFSSAGSKVNIVKDVGLATKTLKFLGSTKGQIAVGGTLYGLDVGYNELKTIPEMRKEGFSENYITGYRAERYATPIVTALGFVGGAKITSKAVSEFGNVRGEPEITKTFTKQPKDLTSIRTQTGDIISKWETPQAKIQHEIKNVPSRFEQASMDINKITRGKLGVAESKIPALQPKKYVGFGEFETGHVTMPSGESSVHTQGEATIVGLDDLTSSKVEFGSKSNVKMSEEVAGGRNILSSEEMVTRDITGKVKSKQSLVADVEKDFIERNNIVNELVFKTPTKEVLRYVNIEGNVEKLPKYARVDKSMATGGFKVHEVLDLRSSAKEGGVVGSRLAYPVRRLPSGASSSEFIDSSIPKNKYPEGNTFSQSETSFRQAEGEIKIENVIVKSSDVGQLQILQKSREVPVKSANIDIGLIEKPVSSAELSAIGMEQSKIVTLMGEKSLESFKASGYTSVLDYAGEVNVPKSSTLAFHRTQSAVESKLKYEPSVLKNEFDNSRRIGLPSASFLKEGMPVVSKVIPSMNYATKTNVKVSPVQIEIQKQDLRQSNVPYLSSVSKFINVPAKTSKPTVPFFPIRPKTKRDLDNFPMPSEHILSPRGVPRIPRYRADKQLMPTFFSSAKSMLKYGKATGISGLSQRELAGIKTKEYVGVPTREIVRRGNKPVIEFGGLKMRKWW